MTDHQYEGVGTLMYSEGNVKRTRRKPKRRRPQHNAHVWAWAHWRIERIYAAAVVQALTSE